MRRWYAPLKLLSVLPGPLKNLLDTYVATRDERVQGMIQVSPFNQTRSTWRVDRVATSQQLSQAESGQLSLASDVGSLLLRHCFEAIWEARTWLIEVNVNDKESLALYRQNGFQPLAHLTYWAIAPDLLQELAQREAALPNLLPVSNADAQLLYQLDTVSVPPLVRQVFDHQIQDFKTSLLGGMVDGLRHWLNRTEVVSGYVFEPQRKAAIGYFKMRCCRTGHRPHSAKLTVHPAYTWLYPELVAQMAQVAQAFPPQPLLVASSDYQPEREEYLNRIGASPVENTLMMSRSVWHKIQEAKPASFESQLTGVLQGLQPSRKPVPGRMSWQMPLPPMHQSNRNESNGSPDSNGKHSPSRDRTINDSQ
jgi:hypothetical protein